jgi:hypothetical protein
MNMHARWSHSSIHLDPRHRPYLRSCWVISSLRECCALWTHKRLCPWALVITLISYFKSWITFWLNPTSRFINCSPLRCYIRFSHQRFIYMTDTNPYILQLLLLRNVGFLELDLVTFYSFQILTQCSHESHSNSYTTISIQLSSYMFWWISEATESVEFHKKDSIYGWPRFAYISHASQYSQRYCCFDLPEWHNLFLQLEIYSEEHMQCYKQIKLGGCQRYTQVQVYTVFSNHYKVSRRYECITSILECINPASLSWEIFLIKGNPWSCHLPLRSNSTLCLFPCSAISISNKGLESMGVLKLHYK